MQDTTPLPTKFAVGQRVRTAHDIGTQGPYGTGMPKGTLGTITHVHENIKGHAYGYGVQVDPDAGCAYSLRPVFFYTFELEENS